MLGYANDTVFWLKNEELSVDRKERELMNKLNGVDTSLIDEFGLKFNKRKTRVSKSSRQVETYKMDEIKLRET